MSLNDFHEHTVLITGASSGIGASFALALAKRGANLILVARRLDRLQQLSAELHEAYGINATPIAQDLASPTAAADLVRSITAAGLTATSLINNAGFATFGSFTTEDPDRLTQELTVDVLTPVRLTSAFLPGFIAAGSGFLINVASMAAYTPTPRMAVYGAAKAFILSFTESLWAETRGTGVTVFALSPGATSSEFNAVVGTDDATAGAKMRSPDQVVATALSHLAKRNPGPSVIDGGTNRITAPLLAFIPRRSTATIMHRMTDPARRATSSASH
ncbi:SDR family NAD(P)-dependent oxidoreductase [Subtercola endophyticus]|uniref:SDR family NAD(P)-dependent oxidoreductase n=1 Tax=Subtercola endophyticus TaxID=2895559 RepID=UPI001E4C8B62|nr:SDR family oxidoreductase [Subtercola endophyticus]UFS59537.1 SDR family oxidoreductase [Subtercola endophyticus]